MSKYKAGTKIQWQWLGRPVKGQIVEAFTEPVTKTIKGKRIKRNGSPQKPAYLVRSDAGNLALKLHSELSAAGGKPRRSTPKMFS